MNTATATLQAYQVMTSTPMQGPRGGKAKPLIQFYIVTATSREEAREIFVAESEPHHLEGVEITAVTACGCRVMPGR